ncbi:MAG: peptide MFS transporter [Balneolaceae bacterium]
MANGTNGGEPTFFGHPKGLSTLFFTEMWERFSYYGMRALLIIFMAAPVVDGGFGFDDRMSGAIYGLYTMGVYLLALPGGWVADRLFGLKKSVWYGGIIIALGHFTMGLPGILKLFGMDSGMTVTAFDTNSFFIGLILVVLGTGLLKPNISAIVGDLYEGKDGAKRDAGFSLFYMGINIGALIAPIITGLLAKTDWHLGFGIAGFGMVLGLIQYKLTSHHLDGIGEFTPPKDEKEALELKSVSNKAKIVFGSCVGLLVLAFAGIIPIDAPTIAGASGVIIAIVGFGYLTYVALFGGLDEAEKKKVVAIGIIFAFAAVFWSGFEQAGSTLNLFAERFTDKTVFGWEMPAAWFQSINSIFIIIFAPVFGAMWVWLAKRNLDPRSPIKFAMGLVLLGVGFLVMYFATKIAAAGNLAAPTWLIFTYMFHTFGELSLSPVGLSLITKLAPKKFSGQMMGIWFLATSLGNLLAGLISGSASGGDAEALANMPHQYMIIVATTIGAGVLLLLISKPMKKLMGDVH